MFEIKALPIPEPVVEEKVVEILEMPMFASALKDIQAELTKIDEKFEI